MTDHEVLDEYVAIAKRLMPADLSFDLVDIEDMTPDEQRFMAESLRQFRADQRDLPPHNLDLLERLYHDLYGELQAADRNTLGGLIEYVRERTVSVTAGQGAPDE